MIFKKITTNETFKQLFSYFFVGLGATLVEWIIFYVLNDRLTTHYAVATALAYIVSTFANWMFGRLLTFKDAKNDGVVKELLVIYATSVIGLLFNEIIMYVCVSLLTLLEMISKIIATGIVFFYNFFMRKFVIYKN